MTFNSRKLPKHDSLCDVLKLIIKEDNGGFGFNMWASIVDRDGYVKVVVFSGEDRASQWPGSRVIAAQKAYTANAFSLPKFPLSTANLYAATQPGGTLYGLANSNPVNTQLAYGGSAEAIGTVHDPIVELKIGGINTFGGGLPLYTKEGELIGAIGVSGDSPIVDHSVAWKIRHKLELDYVPDGVSPTKDDNIIFDINEGGSVSGWGHPLCSEDAVEVAKELSFTHKPGNH